jgi:hypothetical protein
MAWTYKQTWDNATNYVVDDVVLYKYVYYRALADNTNSQPSSTNSDWLILEPVDALVYILSVMMPIDPSRIFIYNQDFNLPTDNGLFVVLQLTDSYNQASTNDTFLNGVGIGQTVNERLIELFVEHYSIGLFSKDNSARLRRADALMAINSNFSLFWQDVFQIKIFRNSRQFANLSILGSSAKTSSITTINFLLT